MQYKFARPICGTLARVHQLNSEGLQTSTTYCYCDGWHLQGLFKDQHGCFTPCPLRDGLGSQPIPSCSFSVARASMHLAVRHAFAAFLAVCLVSSIIFAAWTPILLALAASLVASLVQRRKVSMVLYCDCSACPGVCWTPMRYAPSSMTHTLDSWLSAGTGSRGAQGAEQVRQ